jgi:hypothetical protein
LLAMLTMTALLRPIHNPTFLLIVRFLSVPVSRSRHRSDEMAG